MSNQTDHDRTPSAPRPRPQFGELATPEEQRAAIAVPIDAAAAESVPVADVPAKDVPETLAEQKVTRAKQSRGEQKETADGGVRAPVDRFASWALLGVGLFNILTSSSALIDLPAAITQFFAADGLDPYGPVLAGRVLGIGALVVNVALWILTLMIVQRRVNAGRTSWWIPIVVGVAANVILLVCVGAAMMIDPSVLDYVQRMSGATP
ncbi:hypothetical protein CLV49_3623 [Labedella gwakjiensis]|uniref:Uncharacterized protein n=1 Tax=Labedella gwakjiensis TaxID=390269 RepID=A0A2P8H181_9MICO|nr:DUF6264 family protein [Labedella gwakjiensis]PSL39968.1 hypothetical protein CLV49_3623 [Labedella gwakjiensis]RUQ85675.1 hypothetical protein ELQ93_01155 [Labedella gwakjiensis]